MSALLTGPALTWGLDIGSSAAVTPVASTTQGVVETVQQTAGAAVTQVESTVPVAPAATQPVVNQVQNAVGAAPGAPADSPARTAPAATRTSGRTAAAPAAAAHRATTSRGAVARGGVPTRPVHGSSSAGPRPAAAPWLSHGGPKRSSPRALGAAPGATNSSARQSLGCALPTSLGAVPGGLSLDALLAIVCNAGGAVVPELFEPARIGTTRNASPLATVANVLSAGASLLRARGLPGGAGRSFQKLLAYAQRPSARGNAASAAGDAGVAPAERGAEATAAGARVTGAPQLAAAPTAAAGSAPADGRLHHGVFTRPVDATHGLALVLLIDVSLLGALVLWRLARRWVVPRFI